MGIRYIYNETIAITILLIPIIPIGIFFGKWLNSKLSDKIFYHVTHIALFLWYKFIYKRIFLEKIMNSEMFNKGLSKRRKVLGDEYVDKALATADEFGADLQKLITEYAG